MRVSWWTAGAVASVLVLAGSVVRTQTTSKRGRDVGPKVGQPVPVFSLPDQRGEPRSLESLRGPRGTMLVFFRSADC
jgi:cytochrome oxidase Cu insertion factor (SCO1/SenC/PrrC family)